MGERLTNYLNKVLKYKAFVFTSLFYSLYIIYSIIFNSQFELHSFTNRIISQATADNYDIAHRVNLYFNSIGLFILLFLVFHFILIAIKKIFSYKDYKIFNYSSLGGLCFIIANTYGAKYTISLNLVIAVHIILLINILLRGLFKTKSKAGLNEYDLTIWTLIVSISLYFFYKEILFIYSRVYSILFNVFITLLSAIILFFVHFSLRKNTKSSVDRLFFIIKILSPIALIPILSVLKYEIYYSFRNYNILVLSLYNIYFIIIAIICFVIIFNLFKHKLKNNLDDRINTLYKYYIPFFVISIITVSFFNSYYQIQNDMFEYANPDLAVHQFYLFNKIPFLDNYNSHNLSEIFFPFIHTFINGFGKSNIHLYDYLKYVITAYLTFVLIKRIFNNNYIALFLILLYPLTEAILPSYFSFVILLILVLFKLVKEQTSWRYFWLFFFIMFMIIWRVDIGFPSIFAALITLGVVIFTDDDFVFYPSRLFNGLLYFIIFVIIISIPAFVYKNHLIFNNIQNILSYLDVEQSAGFKELSYFKENVFYSQYFIFPLMVIFISFSSMIYYKLYAKEKNINRYFYITIIFASVFYIVNFQRGLVRHSFMENWDKLLSSFAFLIFSGTIYMFFSNKKEYIKFTLFVVATSIIVFGFKFPLISIHNSTFFETSITKLDKRFNEKYENNALKNVIEDTVYTNKNIKGISEFIKKNLYDNETFLDFTNSPMLYFYTDKENPNFFNQPLISCQNNYLQEQYLNDIKQFNIPIVIFSRTFYNFYDNVDDIPNVFRHYKIAEYIYKNYKPAIIVNNYSVWTRNNIDYNFTDYPVDNYSTSCQEYINLKYIPYIWGKFDKAYNNKKYKLIKKISPLRAFVKADKEKTFKYKEDTNYQNGNYILLKINNRSRKPIDVIMQFGNDNKKNAVIFFKLDKLRGYNDYLIRVSAIYNWHSQNNWVTVYPIGGDIDVKEITILKEEEK